MHLLGVKNSVSPYTVPFVPPRPKPVKGVVLSVVAGALTILAGIAATAVTYLYPANVPSWLLGVRLWGAVIGIFLGLLIILGAIVVWQGHFGTGGALVFLCSLGNLYLGLLWFVPILPAYLVMAIGCVALVLGLVGGIVGILGK